MTSSSSASTRSAPVRKATAPTPAPEPVQEVDLLGGLDDDAFSSSTVAKPPPGFTEKALPAVAAAPVQNNVLGIDGETALGQAQPLINSIFSQMMTLPISKLPQRLPLPSCLVLLLRPR